MEEEKMDTSQGHKISLESLSKEEVISKYKGLLVIAKKAKQAKDEISEENRLLKEQLQQHETQKEADKKALMTMKEMLEAYTENKLQLTTQVSELQKLRQVECETLEKLTIENESLKRQSLRLTEDNESLLRDIENMESQLQQVSCLGKEQKQHLVLLEQEINQLKEVDNKHQEIIIKNNELLNEFQELKEKYKFIKDINTEQRQKFNSLKDRFIEVLKKLKKLKECKRILLETQHEYADSVTQWQDEIITASKVLCKELNDLRKENENLLKKLSSKESNHIGNDFVSLNKINELIELSEKANRDYRNLQKENLELKQKVVVTSTTQCLTQISMEKLNDIWHLSQTALQDYENLKQENLQLKEKIKSSSNLDQNDSIQDLKLNNKLEDLHNVAAKAFVEFQEQSKELQQIKINYEKLQQTHLQDNEKQYKKEFENLQQQFQIINKEKQQLKAELQKINKTNLQDIEKYKKEFENLQQEFQIINEEKQQLKAELQEISIDRPQETIKNEEVNKNLEETLKECLCLQNQLQYLQQDKLSHETAQKSLQDSLQKSQIESQTLAKENAQLSEKLHKLSAQDSQTSSNLKQQLLIAQESLEEYQQMSKQKEIEHCELLDEMRELNEALKARGDLISRQQEEQHVLKTELNINSEKLTKIQQELEQKDKQLNEKQTQIDTTKTKIEFLENSSSLNEEKVRILTIELQNLKTNPNLNDLDNQSDVQSTSTISRADELQRLREVEDSFEDKYNKLRGLAAKLKKKLQEETTNKQKLEKEIQDLKIQETELKSQLENYSAKINDMESLKKQLNDKQKNLDALKTENQKLKSSRKQANVLNLEIEAAEKSLTEVTNKLAQRTSELNLAQEAIQSKDSTIIQLRKEIELLESSKASEIMHSQELKQQIDHLQKTTKDEMHSKQQAYEKSKILEQDVENLKLELENVKLELAQTTSKQEISLKSLKNEKEQLSKELNTTQELLLNNEQKLKQSERFMEDLKIEYLDYKVKAQAVLRKNQTRDSSKERELEEELIAMRASETQFKTTIQTLTTKLNASEKQKDLLNDDNHNLQKRCNELIQLIEDIRSQNDTLSKEIQQHVQQQQETLKQHRQQIESIDICHKEQLQSLNSTHQRQLEQLRKELTSQIRLPPSVGATKSLQSYQQNSNDHNNEHSKLEFLLMEREDAEGSEEAAETLATLAASRKISNDSSTKRSNHDFMPLDELLNTPMNAIHSDTLISTSQQQQQLSDNSLNPNNTADLLQLELNATKEHLQKQETRVRHLTALLAENEQDLAKLTQMNDMLKEELRRQERSVEREQHMHNSEYVKNVIMKFLTLNNVDEKTRLVPVICTILKLTRPETELLNCVAKGQKVSEPTQRQGGWSNFLPWGSNNNNSNNN